MTASRPPRFDLDLFDRLCAMLYEAQHAVAEDLDLVPSNRDDRLSAAVFSFLVAGLIIESFHVAGGRRVITSADPRWQARETLLPTALEADGYEHLQARLVRLLEMIDEIRIPLSKGPRREQ